MESNPVKNYYEKIEDYIKRINDDDSFSNSFKNAITSGDNKLFQKYIIETKIFDDEWVNKIKESLQYLDPILRAPKTFIKNQQELVSIEKAQRVSADTIRYLSSHAQHVQEVNQKGEIIAKSVLNERFEEDFAIYENRFIKTLIDKLTTYIERRYNTIKEITGAYFFNKFQHISNFTFNELHIDYETTVNIHRKMTEDEKSSKNLQLLEQTEELRTMVKSLYRTPMMQKLQGVKPIIPPIQKTNIITKDPNYRKCYELWVYLDSSTNLEFELNSDVIDKVFTNDYIEKIKDTALLNVATIVGNDDFILDDFSNLPKPKKSKKIKILSNDSQEVSEDIQMESNLINEYYFQESRKLYSRRIKERVANGEPFHIALQDIYINSYKITEQIFQSLMEIPEDVKENPIALLRYRLRNQKALNHVYQYKLDDLKKMKEERELNNQMIEKEKEMIEKKDDKKFKIDHLDSKARILLKLSEMREQEKEKLKLLKEAEYERIREEKEKEQEKAREKIREEKEKVREEARKELLLLEDKIQQQIEKEQQRFEQIQQQIKEQSQEKLDQLKAKVWEDAEQEIKTEKNKIEEETKLEIENLNKELENIKSSLNDDFLDGLYSDLDDNEFKFLEDKELDLFDLGETDLEIEEDDSLDDENEGTNESDLNEKN